MSAYIYFPLLLDRSVNCGVSTFPLRLGMYEVSSVSSSSVTEEGVEDVAEEEEAGGSGEG